jgi:hypothetical protein
VAATPEMSVYCSCMEELKQRLGTARAVARGDVNLGSERLNYELVSLMFRKALELTAFSSLAAHKEKYAEVHKNFREHWNAKRLLECIEKVHPEFYPRPVRLVSAPVGGSKLLEPISDGFLTREEFAELYDLTSDVLHTWNPFTERPRAINFKMTVQEWLERFYRLLDLHWIQPAGSPDVWLVQMKGADGKVHVLGAEPTATVALAP